MGRAVYRIGTVRLPKNFSELKYKKGLVITLAGLSIGIIFLNQSINSTKTITPLSLEDSERPIESVAALGQITPNGETRMLAAPLLRTGGIPRISKILVEEGDEVKVGQVLAIFDNREALLADLNIFTARLNTIQNNIIIQSRQVSRYEKAALQGAAPLSVLDMEQDNLNKLIGRENELKSEISRIKIDIKSSQLLSPIDGIVLKLNYRQGERPGSDGVLEVGRNKSMEALIEVYESDISRVRIGQVVSLISENGGFQGYINGTVTRISPQIQQRRVLSTDPTGDADARIVEVRVTLDPISSEKVSNYTGMKVIARFNP